MQREPRSKTYLGNHLMKSTTMDLQRPSWALGFAHVQVAMDEFRFSGEEEERQQGRGLGLEEMECTELVWRPSRGVGWKVEVMLSSYTPRILHLPRPLPASVAQGFGGEARAEAEGEDVFCLRIQQCFLVSGMDEGWMPPLYPTIHFCTHLEMSCSIHVSEANIEAVRRGTYVPDVLRRCSFCKAEFLVDLRYLDGESQAEYSEDHGEGDEGKNLAIIVTKWLNLGDGMDPLSEEWTRHVDTASAARAEMVPSHDNRRIMRAFEAQASAGRDLEQCTRDNGALVKKLMSKRSLEHGMMKKEIEKQTGMVGLTGMGLPHVPSSRAVDIWVKEKQPAPASARNKHKPMWSKLMR